MHSCIKCQACIAYHKFDLNQDAVTQMDAKNQHINSKTRLMTQQQKQRQKFFSIPWAKLNNKVQGITTCTHVMKSRWLTFFPGLTSLKATSAAVFAAAITSAARPVSGPSWRTCVCATTAMNPSIWHPISLYQHQNQHELVKEHRHTFRFNNSRIQQHIGKNVKLWERRSFEKSK